MEDVDSEVPDWTCPRSGRTLLLKSSQLTRGRIQTQKNKASFITSTGAASICSKVTFVFKN